MNKIKIGIVGYGNLGKSIEKIISYYPDFELEVIFTRRNIQEIQKFTTTNAENYKDILKWKNKLDVLMLCVGSATDLPIIGPELLSHFNTVDCYDNHKEIPTYFNNMNQAGIKGNNLGVISIGWDPGLFSMMRQTFNAILPNSHVETFWGPGVSQGHSDAIRKIPGVIGAIQYTIPNKSAIEAIKNGEVNLTTHDKHFRECFVVVDTDANKSNIEKTIKTMPGYFDEYETIVHFISKKELETKHSKLPHGGTVMVTGKTGISHQNIKFTLELESNPEFTASIAIAYARALIKLKSEGKAGALTIYDIPLSYLSFEKIEDLRKKYL